MRQPVANPEKPESRRFDVTLAGDANLDILLYGLPENLALERELLAERIAIPPVPGRKNRGAARVGMV
jgi:hypothetical protein